MSENNLENAKRDFFEVLYDYAFPNRAPSIEDIALGGAYGDMARRILKWGKDISVTDFEKYEWKKYIVNTIIENRNYKEGDKHGICLLLDNTGLDYDIWHEETCNKVISDMNYKHKKPMQLKYGQAQKWLNMTMKNLLVSGQYYEELTKIRKNMHCPIDSIIIAAASDLKIIIRGRKNENSENVNTCWSNLEGSIYRKLQQALSDRMSNIEEVSRINWEMKVWPIYRRWFAEEIRLKKEKGKKWKDVMIEERMGASYPLEVRSAISKLEAIEIK